MLVYVCVISCRNVKRGRYRGHGHIKSGEIRTISSTNPYLTISIKNILILYMEKHNRVFVNYHNPDNFV